MEFPPLSRHADRPLRITAAVLITIALASVIGAVAWSRSRDPGAFVVSDASAPAQAPGPITTSTAPAAPRVDSYADTLERVAPAVVTVLTERVEARAPALPMVEGTRVPQVNDGVGPQRGLGLGSGVLITTDGHLLTNHHVIQGESRLVVELADRRRFDAQVVGSDPPSDLALLKIQATGLPAATLGDSNRVRLGDVVLALGHPLGGQTVTLGVISATERATGPAASHHDRCLQTDAAINAGNSGGALVTARGELVGINSQNLTPSGSNIGIGCAIPVNMARAVMDALLGSAPPS